MKPILRDRKNDLPTIIIGAGPVGLAAAANLVQYRKPFIILESGSQVGANVKKWEHVRLFSPWRYNIDKSAALLLKSEGWREPNLEAFPSGEEFINQYLLPLSETAYIQPFIKLKTNVLSISKKNTDKMKTKIRESIPFVVYAEYEGEILKYEASAVLDATGTWGNPNPANSEGVWLPGEQQSESNLFYGIPDILGKDKKRYQNQHTAVVGSGHSAINTLIELSELKKMHHNTKITWIIRKNKVEDTYGGEENDALVARGALGARVHQLVDAGVLDVQVRYRINQIEHHTDNKINIHGEQDGNAKVLPLIDQVIVNTGNRPDFSFLREVRYRTDFATESVEALAPLIDPNVHSCGTVRPHGEKELRQPERNFYIIGAKSYGRAPTFLMATGYEQVRSVVAHLAGDVEAARKVELDLPETGVCSVNFLSNNHSQMTKPVNLCESSPNGHCL